MTCRLALLTILLAGWAPAAWANDALATVGTGALEFVRADRITMQREDLTLAPREVRIRYEMRNDRGEPFTGRVAFPLPQMAGELTRRPLQLPFPDDRNFVHFRVRVDGQEVAPSLRLWATLEQRDVTEVLRDAGITLAPGEPRTVETGRLKPGGLERLRSMALVGEPENDAPEGQPPREIVHPLWTTHAAFEWDQTFKPGVTVIEHSYVPVTGGSAAFQDRPGGRLELDSYRGQYCIDRGTESALRAAAASAPRPRDGYPGTMRTLSYILTTASNWSGPIGTFHLVLDTGGPGNIVSLCLPDLSLTRTAPTRFEATARNYTPRRNLDVLFYLPREMMRE